MKPESNPTPDLEFNEPERYELREGPFYHFEMDRREFVQILGAGVLISLAGPTAFAQRARSGRTPGPAERLHIAADGVITVLTGKVEFGQGSRTQITQAAAEELRVPMDQIRLIMADSDGVPDDGGTAGSRTTPSTVPSVRRACAAARQLLLEAAAERFQAGVKDLTVEDGWVTGLAGKPRYGYGTFAAEAPAEALKRETQGEVTVTEVAQWRVLGTAQPHRNARDIVTGAHRYPSDIIRPDMLHGKILRPIAYGAELTGIDLASAQALTGVTAVRDGDFVGCAAPTSFAAAAALEIVSKTATWKTGESSVTSANLYEQLRRNASNQRSRRETRGAVEDAMKSAAKVLRQSYHIAYIQHAPMEPRAAVAEWKDDRLTVWTGTQQPGRVREELARTFRIPADRVRLIVPDTGGGFGGKHSGETAVEAARLAKAAGKPVSVRWSREEEFTWAYFRPAGVIDLAGGLDGHGALVAWEHINFNSGASAIATPYDVPNVVTEFRTCDAPLRSGSYRALASTANAFARESFMDELAAEAGADPLQFRLQRLSNSRLRAVLEAAARAFGWEQAWKPNTARQTTGVGLACGTEKDSFVATCAEIRMEADQSPATFRVTRVCAAFECGAIQNPANLKAQVEGCIIQGLGGALSESIAFENGRVLNPRFSRYRVPRFQDVPRLDIVLLNRPDLPSVGAGETPIIGIAPAVANALFHAVQTRVRSLPIKTESLQAAL